MVNIPRDNPKAMDAMATIIYDGINAEVYNRHQGRRVTPAMPDEINFEVREAMLAVMDSLGIKGYVPHLRVNVNLSGANIEVRCPVNRDMINIYTWAYRLLEGMYG